MKNYELKLNEIDFLVEDVLKEFKDGVVVLSGDLASGKTTLVKEFAKKLGFCGDVTSPTFSLQQCYGDSIYHYDMYNHGLEHFISLGMLEELDKEGLHLVERGDDELLKILSSAEIKTITIQIAKTTNDTRQYEVNYAHA